MDLISIIETVHTFLLSHYDIFSYATLFLWGLFAFGVITARKRRFFRFLLGVLSAVLICLVFSNQSLVIEAYLYSYVQDFMSSKSIFNANWDDAVWIVFHSLYVSFPVWIVYCTNLVAKGVACLLSSLFGRIADAKRKKEEERETRRIEAEQEAKNKIVHKIAEMEATYKTNIIPFLKVLNGNEGSYEKYSMFVRDVQKHYENLERTQEVINREAKSHGINEQLSLSIFDT